MIGEVVGGAVNSFIASAVDELMTSIWRAATTLLRESFALLDQLLGFGDGSQLVDPAGGPAAGAPFAAIWPTLRWVGAVVAFGLLLWQLTLTVLRGGTGFWRAVTGPAAYGVAVAVTLGVVAALLGAAEGLTTLLLQRGLGASNFRTILDDPRLAVGDDAAVLAGVEASVRAVLLGLVALFGVLPAALGYTLQMIFRQAVVIVLIATLPITAAGLLTDTTATWFRTTLRWMLAAVLMKPALALVLVVGVNMLSTPTGVGGLLAGTGVLLIGLFCPLALFRLLAFVEPGTPSGAAARSALTRHPPGSPAPAGDVEHTHTSRFDLAHTDTTTSATAGAGGSAGGDAGGGVGGGPTAGGRATAGSTAAGGAAAGGGAAGSPAGAVGAVNAAVAAAAAFATTEAGSTMNATGIGHGPGPAFLPGGGRTRSGTPDARPTSGGSSSNRSPDPTPTSGKDGGDGAVEHDPVRRGDQRPPDPPRSGRR